MVGMEAFYTRDAANEGRRIALLTPAGQLTEHWLQVRSRLSDEFRSAQAVALQAVAAASPDKRAEVGRAARLGALASLVAAWSFDQECTPANVAEFLGNAPQIADRVNEFAGDDEAFFAPGSASSSPTSEPK